MSLESARAVYPILVSLARDLSPGGPRAADGRLDLVRRLLPALQGSRRQGNAPDHRHQAAQAAPGRLPRKQPARPERPDHPEAEGPQRLRQPAPALRRLVGALRHPGRDDRRRRRLLVQAVPGRPRLRRLARGAVLLTDRPGSRSDCLSLGEPGLIIPPAICGDRADTRDSHRATVMSSSSRACHVPASTTSAREEGHHGLSFRQADAEEPGGGAERPGDCPGSRSSAARADAPAGGAARPRQA